MATSFSSSYNAYLADDANYRYRQAQMEGAALRGELGPQSQILALSEVYKEHKAAGRLAEAAAIRAQVNLIVEGK
jgi:hypothetical protein